MEKLKNKKEFFVKMIVCGDMGSGKTMLINRLVNGLFSIQYKATIGVDFSLFVHQAINSDINYRIQIFDIAGMERFGNMLNVYFKGSMCALVVVDMTRISTFKAAGKWCQMIKKYIDNNEIKETYPIGIVFNKYDIIEHIKPNEKKRIMDGN